MRGEPAGQRHRQVGELAGDPHRTDRHVRLHAAARSTPVSDSIIAVTDTPVILLATEPSLMADSSALPSRWISEVRAWTVLIFTGD